MSGAVVFRFVSGFFRAVAVDFGLVSGLFGVYLGLDHIRVQGFADQGLEDT